MKSSTFELGLPNGSKCGVLHAVMDARGGVGQSEKRARLFNFRFIPTFQLHPLLDGARQTVNYFLYIIELDKLYFAD